MEIQIHYRDEHYVAVEKPSAMLVHPYSESTDRVFLMKLLRDQIGQHVFPIHRLDRPVSGVVLFALSSRPAAKIQEYWHHEETRKTYLTLCRRQLTEPGEFNFELSNDKKVKQEARTLYWPLKTFEDYTFLKVQIKTGRKHQIRRHFSRRVFNIVGDTMHGKGKDNRFFREEFDLHRIFLHAYQLEFIHPYTKEKVMITSPLPLELERVLSGLGLPDYRELL